MTTSEAIRPRLRQLSLGEILDVSIKICLSNWRTLLPAVLVVVVPVQIVITILTADYTLSDSSSQTAQQSVDEFNQYLGSLVISGVLQGVAVLFATAVCLRAIARAYLGEPIDWRSSMSYAVHRAPALLWVALLAGLGIVLGMLFFIVPGVWLSVAWAFAMPVLLVEGLRGRSALGRSFKLVRRRWWQTFGVIAVGFILASIVSALVQAVFVAGIFAGKDSDALVLLFDALAGVVGLAVTTPFQAALLTVLYFDLRVRKEGFDLELLASEIGGGAPAAASEPPAPVPASEQHGEDEPPRLPGVPGG